MAASALLQPDSSYFFHQLTRVRRGVLVLDFSDCIASLCVARDRYYFCPSLVEILDSILTTTCTRVILFSTQPILDLVRGLGLQRHPEIWDAQQLFPTSNSIEPDKKRITVRRSGAPAFFKSCGTPGAWFAKCQSDHKGTHPQSAWGMLVRPEFYMEDRVFVGTPESLPHLLIDWLRACGGELC